MDSQGDSEPLVSGLSSVTAFPDNLDKLFYLLCFHFPRHNSRCLSQPPSQSRLWKKLCMKPTSAVRPREEYVTMGTVPEKWDSVLEATGSRNWAY